MGIKVLPRLLLAVLLTATSAWGAEIHGRSSTQLHWFNNDFVDERQVELNQYLRFSITGMDKAGKLSLYGYARASLDFTGNDAMGGRVYYLYGDYRDLFDRVDFKLGRQFVNLAAGSAIIDGTQVTVKKIGPVALTVMGGRNVIFGINSRELTNGGDWAMGVAGYLTGFKHTDLEVSWFRKWVEGDEARDIIGATFKQHLFNNLKVYGNTRYDLVTESFAEVLAGIKYFPMTNLILTGEYFRSYPLFDATSIYSVFAVNRYQEGLFRAEYFFSELFSLRAGYSRQDYDDDENANVYHVGGTVRPFKPLRISAQYENRRGFGGKTNGVIADAVYQATRELEVAGGITYDVYERDSFFDDEIARVYWLGGNYRLAKNMRTSLRLEENVNARYRENLQGRFVFDYDF